MQTEIVFVGRQSTQSVAMSIGFNSNDSFSAADGCPFLIGDVLHDNATPGFFFRVIDRVFTAGGSDKPPTWVLLVEPARDPLEALE